MVLTKQPQRGAAEIHACGDFVPGVLGDFPLTSGHWGGHFYRNDKSGATMPCLLRFLPPCESQTLTAEKLRIGDGSDDTLLSGIGKDTLMNTIARTDADEEIVICSFTV
jgi:hypothetical protein